MYINLPDFSIQVVECLIKLIERCGESVNDDGSIFLACDTVMNILLKVHFSP